MTFEKAYCTELDADVTAYKARREFFAQEDDSLRYHFFCPDSECNVELVGVKIYSTSKLAMPPHFRTFPNREHSKTCSIIKELEVGDGSKDAKKNRAKNGNKTSKFVNEFILQRPAKKSDNKGPSSNYDDEFDIEPRTKKHSTPSEFKAGDKPIKTSYLENVVDCYEAMDEEDRKKYTILLNGELRTYKNTFKNIKYFQDGTNFIFYGQIKPIKPYGKNFSIKFIDRAWIDNKSYDIKIYITEEIINQYRLKRLFNESMKQLSSADKKLLTEHPPVCYFVGAYPTLKTVPLQESVKFDILEVNITNLDHLVIKFKE